MKKIIVNINGKKIESITVHNKSKEHPCAGCIFDTDEHSCCDDRRLICNGSVIYKEVCEKIKK
jgi:hypothetical protein